MINTYVPTSVQPLRKCRFDSGSFQNVSGLIVGWNTQGNCWNVILSEDNRRVIPVLAGSLRPLKTVVREFSN